MKRKGSFYERIYSFENLYSAYLKVKKGRRYKKEVLEFSHNLEENLFKIQKELKNETYKHGNYRKFIVRDSKKREIKAPIVKDRVIHHALCNLIDPIFNNTFYDYSYACRKGKGNHKAVKALKRKLKNKEAFYCLKADVSKYFDSVDLHILLKIIEKKIKDKRVLSLIKEILESNDKGLPIGNLTSQLFANVYLNELDQFLKRELKIEYFFRYMDDFLILEKDKKKLFVIKNKIEDFLHQSLGLTFNKKVTRIFPIKTGIDFLGYIIFQDYTLLRKKTVLKMFKKLKKKTQKEALNAWRAYSKNTKSYGLENSLFKKIKQEVEFVKK